MRFDNAFKTAANTVGMQFKEKDTILTVYQDKKGVLVCSDHATVQQQGELVAKYEANKHRFMNLK